MNIHLVASSIVKQLIMLVLSIPGVGDGNVALLTALIYFLCNIYVSKMYLKQFLVWRGQLAQK